MAMDSDKNVYSFIQLTADFSQNMLFERNNWLSSYPFVNNPCLDKLNSQGIAIWLSSKGEFCYRTTPDSTIHTMPLRYAEIVLTKLLNCDIQIVTKSKSIKTPKKPFKDTPALVPQGTDFSYNALIDIIYVKDLLLIEKDMFAPLESKEFFIQRSCNLNYSSYYRNTFLPSTYLQFQGTLYSKFNNSITLQYIYYLANYQKDRFYFIMNWLAAFFKNLNNRSQTALVFLGNKESGKEILFEEIIRPLFGKEYCLKITDTILETTNIQKLLKNKLFYNIDNISDSVIKNKKIKKIINDLLSKDTIDVIESKESILEYQKYGQTLITIDEAYLSYIDKDFEFYSLFKIPDELSLADHFNPDSQITRVSKNEENKNLDYFKEHLIKLNIISTTQLIKAIKDDLANFALILKGYTIDLNKLSIPFENDDRKYLQNNFEDKLKAFHEAISKHKTSTSYFQKIQNNNAPLYEELINDFKLNQIKQKNLIKYFSILYPEENVTSSRTLMAQLRKTDNDFYKVANLKSGNGGIKYFELP